MRAVVAVIKEIARPEMSKAQKGGVGRFSCQEWFDKELRGSNPFDQYLWLIFMTHFAEEGTMKACEWSARSVYKCSGRKMWQSRVHI